MLQIIGGLHDYINTLPRDTLINWALAAEDYVRDKKNIHPMGGLDDYINRLSNSEIAQKILKYASENPELNNKDLLEKLVKKYITDKDAPTAFLDEGQIMGGLHDYIFREPRETLINWALAAEKYVKSQSSIRRMGGLDDYIDSLTDEQIATKVLEMAAKYPVLNSSTKLDALVKSYNIQHFARSH